MARNGIYIAVIVAGLLLFVAFFRRKKHGEYDDFFRDTEIVKDFDEAPIPTTVPNSILAATTDSGNSNSECEKSGYVALNLTNATTSPITVDLINVLASATAASATTSVSTPSGVFAMLVYNGFIYAVKNGGQEMYAYSYSTNETTTIALPLATADDKSGSISQANGNLYIVGRTLISVVSVETLQLVTQFTIPGVSSTSQFDAMYTALWGNNLYVPFRSSSDLVSMAIIDTVNISFSTVSDSISIAGSALNICTLVYPKYKYQESNRYGYITVNDFAVTNRIAVFDFENNTFSTPVSGLPAAPQAIYQGYGAARVNNHLYIPGNLFMNIIDLSTNSYVSSINTGDVFGFSIYNDQNYIYTNSSDIKVIDTDTNTIVDNVAVTPFSDSVIINNVLYIGSFGSSNAYGIDVNESNTTTINTIIKNYNINPSASNTSIAFNSSNIIFGSTFPGGFGTIPVPIPITQQALVNLNNMANFVNNPGEICGIFYRSLTVAQMSNVFAINWTGITGETNNYKLIPITYKDTMSVLNQIYVSKFAKPIIINNNLQFNHVINPGEDVYIKLYVRKFVSSTEMLKTGKIEPSNTNGNNPEQEDEPEEEWLDIDEVESQEWDAVHIQCPEPKEEPDESEHRYEPEPELMSFEEEFEDEFEDDGWLSGGLK